MYSRLVGCLLYLALYLESLTIYWIEFLIITLLSSMQTSEKVVFLIFARVRQFVKHISAPSFLYTFKFLANIQGIWTAKMSFQDVKKHVDHIKLVTLISKS